MLSEPPQLNNNNNNNNAGDVERNPGPNGPSGSGDGDRLQLGRCLSLIHISEPTRPY